jgi:hypothetical protein
MADLVSYCLGGGIGFAAIFFPLTFRAMKSHVTFRGGLRTAWKPFGFSVVLLAIVQFVQAATKPPQAAITMSSFLAFLIMPILTCALVLFFTYRQPPTEKQPAG